MTFTLTVWLLNGENGQEKPITYGFKQLPLLLLHTSLQDDENELSLEFSYAWKKLASFWENVFSQSVSSLLGVSSGLFSDCE